MPMGDTMFQRLPTFLIPVLVLAGLGLLTEIAGAQATPPPGAEQMTVWSGVYADGQAARGRALYEGARCSGCHGLSLEGGRAGRPDPPLRGEQFIERWREDTLQSLYTLMSTLMPRNDPGTLTDEQYVDILAYLLQSNGFPTGSTELGAGSLRSIRIEGKDGPLPLPHRATVQVIGCMTEASEDDWMLTMAPAAARTRTLDTTTPEELQAAAKKPLGSLAFQLRNLLMLGAFEPSEHRGHKMMAKGVLLRDSDQDRISLTLMESVAPTCEP